MTQLNATRSEDSLIVSGFKATPSPDESWSITSFKEDFFFAYRKKNNEKNSGGACYCATDNFIDFLTGIHFRKWNGKIRVDTGYGEKILFFQNGELVFAKSNIMDDRLGEVMYRLGILNFDQFLSSTVKVTTSLKFGQVLVQSHYLKDFELWNALKEQVKLIVKSLFMTSFVYFEIDSEAQNSSEIVFNEGTSELIESCYGYGTMFRSFVATLKPSSWIKPLRVKETTKGTFLYDLLSIIGNKISVDDLVNQSKMQKPYILSILMDLNNRGLCSIEDTNPIVLDNNHPNLRQIKELLKAFEIALGMSKAAFEAQKTTFPIDSLKMMVESFNSEILTFFLDASGNISKDSLYSIFSQCSNIKGRADFFEVRLKSLISFLLQLTGDHLSDLELQHIRNSIRDYYK